MGTRTTTQPRKRTTITSSTDTTQPTVATQDLTDPTTPSLTSTGTPSVGEKQNKQKQKKRKSKKKVAVTPPPGKTSCEDGGAVRPQQLLIFLHIVISGRPLKAPHSEDCDNKHLFE